MISHIETAIGISTLAHGNSIFHMRQGPYGHSSCLQDSFQLVWKLCELILLQIVLCTSDQKLSLDLDAEAAIGWKGLLGEKESNVLEVGKCAAQYDR